MNHDYRVSRTNDGLVVEVLDYHAEPLTLTKERLAEFGFVTMDPGRRRASGDDLEDLAARAIELLEERVVYESKAIKEIEDLRERLVRARSSHGFRPRDPEPPRVD